MKEDYTPFGYHTFKADYLRMYKTMVDGPLNKTALLNEVTALNTVYGPSMNADPYSGNGFSTVTTFINNRFATITPQLNAYMKATGPSPANAATNVSVNADLSWVAGIDGNTQNVYFGTSNPPAFKVNQTASTYDPGTLIL